MRQTCDVGTRHRPTRRGWRPRRHACSGPPSGTEHAGGDGVPGAHPVELRRLYVETERVGGGVGGRLMVEVLRRAATHGHDVVWLGVWEHNLGAQRFYARHGFVEVGRHDFVLGSDVQVDLVLARSL